MESDDSGKLRAFREKFGRGWDASRMQERDEVVDREEGEEGEEEVEGRGGMGEDNLMDLISGYGQEAEEKGEAAGSRKAKERSGKGKGGER